jgi:signal transduction histidine kinase
VTARRADLLVGAGAVAVSLGFAFVESIGAIGAVAGAIVGAALAGARLHPRAACAVALAALLAAAPFGAVSFGAALLAGAHAFNAGRREPLWPGLAWLVALTAAVELGIYVDGGPAVPFLYTPIAGWGAGRALREREQVAAQLAARVRDLEQEREAHAALSVRYERARIASELHDIVAHAISVMVVQASAGQRLAAHDPEATAETFRAIAGAAHQAEQDMDRLVALLGDEAAIGSAPDLSLVEELVGRAAASGLDVTLRLEGERDGLPAEHVEAAYHVVQEGLTNALRYAAGAPVRVHLGDDEGALCVEVTNERAAREAALAGAGTGTGLQGLRERVGSCGGTLDAGPTSGGGWRVGARLPRRVAAGRAGSRQGISR